MTAAFDVMLGAAFLQGLLGSLHCAGMCGPLLCLACSGGKKLLAPTLAYNLIRMSAYMLVGMLLGTFGSILPLPEIGDIAFYLGIGTVLVAAIYYLLPEGKTAFTLPAPLARWVGKIQQKSNPTWLAAALGLISAILPCGLLLPAYSMATISGKTHYAALIMAAFALGTMPMMFTIGLSGTAFFQRIKALRWRRLLAGSLVFLCLAAISMRTFFHEHSVHQHHKETTKHQHHKHH